MKKQIFLFLLLVLTTISYAQNTIPTTTVNGALEVKDSLTVTRDITAKQDVVILGEVTAKDTLRAKEDVIASKDVKVEGSIYVGDKLNVEGSINTNGAIFIKNTAVMSIRPNVGNPTLPPIGDPTTDPIPTTVFYGPQPNVGVAGEAANPNTSCLDGEYGAWVQHNFGGMIQLFDNSGNGVDYNPGGSVLKMASWPTGSSIDVSGGRNPDGTTAGGLLMNFFCGKGISMCEGPKGGVVSIGKHLEVGNVWSKDLTCNFNLNTGQAGINKAFKIFNSSFGDVFTVYPNGKTQIGTHKTQPPHTDALLTVDGKVACRSLYVLKPTSWADFVFKKNDLEKLSSVEKYIKENKHLPGLPSEKEILNNGYDINEMDAKLLEKIETLYLHIIKLEKEIKELKGK
jgi:hypothetical protein